MKQIRRFIPLFLPLLLVISLSLAGCSSSSRHGGTTPTPTPTSSAPVTARFAPADETTGVCVDTLLKITFDSTPSLGGSGVISIYRVDTDALVDTINMADPNVTTWTGTLTFGSTTKLNAISNNSDNGRIVNYYPVLISGNTATIVPHNNKLSYGVAYYVTIANGVLTGNLNGSAFTGISDKTVWNFTVKASAPAGTLLTVNSNGTADFCTVQGAIDNIPAANTTPYTISIADGTYTEMLYLRNKQNIALQGQSRTGTIIEYNNYDSFNTGTGGGIANPITSSTSLSSSARGGRSILLVNGSTGLVIDNLTIRSTHAQNSAANNQAEVMYLNGATTDQYIVKNCDLISYQDTVQTKSNAWFYNCLIAGDVDFIWGACTTVVLENCEIRSRYNPSGNGYLVQARTPLGTNKGFVFLNCTLTSEGSPTGTTLARSGGSGTYFDNVAYINCTIGTHISADGWLYAPVPNPAVATATSGWKVYNNTRTFTASAYFYTLTTDEYNAGYANRSLIFGGWNPSP